MAQSTGQDASRLESHDPAEEETHSTPSTTDSSTAGTAVSSTSSTTDSSTAGTAASTSTADAETTPVPPTSLALSGSRPRKRKVLLAPALSLSLGHSDSLLSEDFLPPSPNHEDHDADLDLDLDLDLDAMETPSDTESMPFPFYDPDLLDEMRRLGVACSQGRGCRSSPGFARSSAPGLDAPPLGWMLRPQAGCSAPGLDAGLGFLEDEVDSQGTKWRRFSQEEAGQESRVNMSLIQPYLRVLSHGGYYGDGTNDIIVFSSCYLPENSLENYQCVMDNLFRYVVGTLDLMVTKDYAVVYLCAGGQKERLPGIGWLRDCYTTIDRRLRKNLKALYVLHPTWYIKALITFIKPFISSKFSRKLQFVDSLQDLSLLVPTEHVQIPDCVTQYDQSGSG